ncbi:hypothetical protein Tco_1226531 [Tanacetum coccineum]
MRTRSSSNLVGESSPNPTTSNPKRHNRRCSKQPFSLEESPLDTMVNQRTMAELLRAPTEGYAEEIVVPPILAEHFELKHSLINMMTSDQFFGLEKYNPHDHIRWFNKITSIIKYKDVPNLVIKLMLFPFSLAGAARRWLEKEPPRSILTWEDLVSKFINEFFHPSRTTNLQNKNFPNLSNNGLMKSFHEHDRYKISFVHALIMDNIQGYVSAAAVNYNQDNSSYHPPSVANQIRPPASFWVPGSLLATPLLSRKVNRNAITTQVALVLFGKNGSSVHKAFSFINPRRMTSEETLTDPELAEYTIKVPPPLFQKAKPPLLRNYVVHQRDPLNPNIPYPLRINKEKQQDNDEIQIHKFWQMFKQLHINISLADALILILKYQKMLKSLLPNKEKLLELANTPLNENCSSVILKKLPEKLGDPGKFLIPFGFSELNARMSLYLVGKFTCRADFIIDDYESNPGPPHLGKPSTVLSSDFLPSPECDSVFYEDFSEVDALPSTNNEDKIFNPGILIHENLFEVTIRATPDKNVKKISMSNASLILEDFNPPLYELPFHKEVLGSETLLSFSSKNEEKVFNPGILTSKGVHTSLLSELSHWDSKAFKVIKFFKSPMEILPCSYGEDIRVKMDDPNITMEEYIRLEEEKARRRAIVFNDMLTSEAALSCKPTVNSLNNDEIDFRISFDECDDEDCTVRFSMSSDNASSAVTYISVSSDSNGPSSWGIPLVNTGELPEMDPYEEVAQQGQAHPLSPAYVPDPMELDEHVPVYVLELEHPEYHAPSADDIQVEDQPYADGVSPTAESSRYHADSDSMEEDSDEDSIDYPDEPEDGEEDDDEDPEEDPSEEHEPEDDDDDDDIDDEDEEPTKDEEEEHPAPIDSFVVPVVDPVSSAGDTEAFETDESAPTPRSPQTRVPFSQTRLRRIRKAVRLEPPMSAYMEACIAEHAAAPIPPTSPAYDQAPLGHRAAMIRMRDDTPEEDMPPQRRFVLTAPPPGCDGLIPSPGHDAQTIARVADRAEDVGYVRALQASKHRMMTFIKEVNLRVSYQAQVRRQESEDFYTQLHDARTDRRDIRLEIDVVRVQRTAYETELHEVRQAYLSFEARNRTLLAQLETLETHMSRMEWQRQRAEDDAVRQMMRTHVLEARAQIDTVGDTGSSC